MTEREGAGVELLLSQPEIVAWLELSEQEMAVLLAEYERKADEAPPPRS